MDSDQVHRKICPLDSSDSLELLIRSESEQNPAAQTSYQG
jgi:hypothetical protein